MYIVPAAYPEQKSVRNVRAHREMVIHIERTGFVVLVCIVTNDSRSKISRFKRNMPAYESVLSGLKHKVDTQISPRNIVNMPIII